MTDKDILKERLAAAELAYHELQLGKTVQAVGHDGRNVTFTPSDAARLAAYIQNLKQQLGRGSRRSYGIGI